MRRTKAEIGRMALRVGQEGPVRVEDLTGAAGASAEALVRYAIAGKGVGGRRVVLDAVRDGDGRWWSSFAAVARFKAAVEALAERVAAAR